ncbi:MAG TPA: hypothetical protein VGR70_04765 [Stellaceae bacterium]|nr:hypothetical protein [Stellaceae bacterium]
MIKTADLPIDLGREGGDDGGCIVATGAPSRTAWPAAQPARPPASSRPAFQGFGDVNLKARIPVYNLSSYAHKIVACTRVEQLRSSSDISWFYCRITRGKP